MRNNSKYYTQKRYTGHDLFNYKLSIYNDIENSLKSILTFYFKEYIFELVVNYLTKLDKSKKSCTSILQKLDTKNYDKMSNNEKALVFDTLIDYLKN